MARRSFRSNPITRREIAAVNNFHSLGFKGEPVDIPAKRAKPVQREHHEQVAIVRWWMLAHKGFGLPEMALFATPNGGPRNIIAGATLKAEGVRAGVSDLTLAVPRGKYHGAYIECKAKGGVLSPSQIEFQKQMEFLGYRAVTCYGAESAIAFIKDYLGEKPTPFREQLWEALKKAEAWEK